MQSDKNQEFANGKYGKEDFGQLYDRHYRTIFNFIYRRLLNYDLAKDMCSETFMKAYLNFGSFKYRGKPVLAWFYGDAPQS